MNLYSVANEGAKNPQAKNEQQRKKLQIAGRLPAKEDMKINNQKKLPRNKKVGQKLLLW